mgnify:CR=1 FL=1
MSFLNKRKPSAYDNDFLGLNDKFAPIEQFYGYSPNYDKDATFAEKNDEATEAMKQFNLFSFQRAAPGVLFGLGDSGFKSAKMKAKDIGFRNVYDSLFGKTPIVPPIIIPSSTDMGSGVSDGMY